MATNYGGYDAPQFVDLETFLVSPEDKERIEAYFDCDHENPIAIPNRSDGPLEISSEFDESDESEEIVEYYTPGPIVDMQENRRLSKSMVNLSETAGYREEQDTVILVEDEQQSDGQEEETLKAVGQDENGLSESIANLDIQPQPGPSKIENNFKAPAKSRRCTSHNNSYLHKRSNSTSRLVCSRLTELSKPKVTSDKFVSLVEAMNKYQKGTPERYHTKPKSAGPSLEKLNGPIASTVPQSPALATKIRVRPTSIISMEEKELIEFERFKNFKIKANPVNRKVLGPMKPPHFEKKPPTEIKAFNITEVRKKVVPPTGQNDGRANPVPAKTNLAKKRTVPITPMVLKRNPPKPVAIIKPPVVQEIKSNFTGGRTVTKPFSFDERDKRLLARKEELIQVQIEAEKKAREFQARPIPKGFYREPPVPVKLTRGAGSMESLKSIKSDDGLIKFKPRPPISLMIEPFIPKKSERPLTAISPFDLNLERRSRERREFYEKMKEKERRQEEELKMMEEQNRIEEELHKQLLRKQTEYKAKPIRKFKELPHVAPKPATIPETPKLSDRRNKENLAEELNSTN